VVDSSQNINSKNEAISIVIPAFNEEGAITNGIREIVEVMSSTDIKYELIIVDDGFVF
tara:strand:+ start:912 stop:1085 length:174 start_codon:yes stop_codon:yes gene_type:complete